MWLLLLCAFVLPGGSISLDSDDQAITCTAGVYVTGQTASVTCHFGHNINGTPHHIEVMWYPFSGPGGMTGYDALRCHPINNGSSHCIVHEGFNFDCSVTDRLILTIANVTTHFEGSYACQVLSLNQDRKRCTLTVKDKASNELSNTSTTPTHCTEKDQSPGKSIGMITGFAILIILLLISVTLNVVYFRKQRCCASKSQTNHQGTNQAGGPQANSSSNQPFVLRRRQPGSYSTNMESGDETDGC